MTMEHQALLELLDAHWVVHVAWPDPQGRLAPHCTPLYYARLKSRKECAEQAPSLIFFSDPLSEHGQRQRDHIEVGASIGHETADISRIRGASLRAQVKHPDSLSSEIRQCARADYLSRHPQAAPFLDSGKASLYQLVLRWAKLTDNQRGIGKHLELEFSASPH